MEQMCSYCETFFVVPPHETGPMDICPKCYEEYGSSVVRRKDSSRIQDVTAFPMPAAGYVLYIDITLNDI